MLGMSILLHCQQCKETPSKNEEKEGEGDAKIRFLKSGGEKGCASG
jgi:hypothetical protein